MPNRFQASPSAKKRFVIIFLPVLGIVCLLLSGARSRAEANDVFSAIIAKDDTSLYAEPSSNASVLGKYYNGTIINASMVADAADGQTWCVISIPDPHGMETPSVVGYMRMDDLIRYDIAMEKSDVPYACPVGEVVAGATVSLRKEPQETSPALAELYNGVIVEVMGDWSEWLHVRVGRESGFLPAAYVMYTGEASPMYAGPPPRGYAILTPSLDIDGYMIAPEIYSFPNVSSWYEDALYVNYIALFSQHEQWLQIREETGRPNGFIHDVSAVVYWMKDMLVQEPVALTRGVYRVGQDLPSGLYTFRAPEGAQGSVEVTRDSPSLYKWYNSTGASYTMYLVEGASVSITGEGILSPMQRTNILTAAGGWKYEGDGRFFIGEEMVFPPSLYLTIRLLPGETAGYYVISDLNDEAGTGERPDRVRVLAGDERYVYMRPGTFLELRNCVVEIRFGNG